MSVMKEQGDDATLNTMYSRFKLPGTVQICSKIDEIKSSQKFEKVLEAVQGELESPFSCAEIRNGTIGYAR
eukprot:scaffold176671_cov51-Attheya_sp.AAC.1